MHTFGLTVFSIVMAVIGYFQFIPLKAMQPVYSISERLQEGFCRVHFGGVFDKAFQEVHGNNLSVKLGLQTVPTPTVPNSANYTTRNITDRISMIGNWDKLDHWAPRNVNQTIGSIPGAWETAGFSSTNLLFIMSLTKPAILYGLPVILTVGMLSIIVFAFWRNMQTANAEIMGFTSKVRSTRTSILQKLDMVALAADKHLDQTKRRMLAEQERIHEELAAFHPSSVIDHEVQVFREKFELQVQDEFNNQTAWVKEYLRDLEQARQTVPDPGEIRAKYEELRHVFQQPQEACANLDDTMKHIESFLKFFTQKQGRVLFITQDAAALLDEEIQPTHSIPRGEEQSHSKNSEEEAQKTAQTELQHGKAELEKPLAQWVMASARGKMTPEESDKARRIRRERVQMRCATRTPQRNNKCQVSVQPLQSVPKVKATMKNQQSHW